MLQIRSTEYHILYRQMNWKYWFVINTLQYHLCSLKQECSAQRGIHRSNLCSVVDPVSDCLPDYLGSLIHRHTSLLSHDSIMKTSSLGCSRIRKKYKALHTGQPPYLSEVLQHYEPTRTLRSSSSSQLSVPRHNLEFGSRAFRISAPKIWNLLPHP